MENVICILFLALAFAWLMLETNWLTIQLPMGKTKNKVLALPPGNVKPVLLLDTFHIKPSEFQPLDMPITDGTLNIGYKWG